MKGDYIQIVIRGLAETTKVQAEKDGSRVEVKMPERNEQFIRVEVVNKADQVISTHRFLASEVIVIREGHEQIARSRVRISKK